MRLGELLAACLPSLCHACGEPVERWGGLRFATLCARCDDALPPQRPALLADNETSLAAAEAAKAQQAMRAVVTQTRS